MSGNYLGHWETLNQVKQSVVIIGKTFYYINIFVKLQLELDSTLANKVVTSASDVFSKLVWYSANCTLARQQTDR